MTGVIHPQPPPPQRPWLPIAVVMALLIVAGNIVGYILYAKPDPTQPTPAASVTAPPERDTPDEPKTTPTTSLAEEQREAGVRALREGKYAKAIASFEAAIKLDPKVADAAVLLDVAKNLQEAEAQDEIADETETVAEVTPQPRTEPTRRRRVRRTPRRRRRVQREVSVEPETGMLAVTTVPAALTVEVDDFDPQTSPVELDLEPGPHDVRILKDGEVLETQRVVINADQRTKIERDFSGRLARAAAPPPPPPAAPPPPTDGVSKDEELDLVALLDRDQPKETPAARTTTTETPTRDGSALTPTPAAASPRLVVFWPGRSSSTLEQSMRSEMGGVDVRVVTRTGDLRRALSSPTDAVMASPYVLRSNGLAPSMSAKANGSGRYFAVSLEQTPVKAQIANQTIGVVDELGRNAMPAFVQKLLGSSRQPRLRRVTKVEDLLPLLQFSIAKTVLVKERDFSVLEKRTQRKLHTLPLSASATPLAVAFADGGRRAVVERAVRGMGNQSKQSLGVDSWR
ncbi:MAG: PEGA domain-containing protein [Deltaproteobacteria bacterium]|jgi:hypothetical protein